MSHLKDIAQSSAEICVTVAGLATGAATGLATLAIPIATLAAIGITLQKSCAKTACTKTVELLLKDMGKSRDIPSDVLDRVRELLDTHGPDVSLNPKLLSQAASVGDLETEGVRLLMKALPNNPGDYNARSLLETIFTRALNTCINHGEFKKALSHQLLIDAARANGETLTLLEDIKKDTTDLKAMVAELVDREKDRARDWGIKEGMLIGIARSYAEGNPGDFDSALRGVERALQVAREEREKGKLGSNLPAEITRIIALVDDLSNNDQFDEAEAELDAAIRASESREAEEKASRHRLHDKGITQAILTRSVDNAVKHELGKLALDYAAPAHRVDALLAVTNIWINRGRDKGLNFDLQVAIALAEWGCENAEPQNDPGKWFDTLGTARATLGERQSDPSLLHLAVNAFTDALDQFPRVLVPLDWAMTKNNLGNALQTIGQRDSDTGVLRDAVAAYEDALLERTRRKVPLDWAMTQGNLCTVELAFFDLTGLADHLDQAQHYLNGAREVFADAQASQYLAMTSAIQSNIDSRRAALRD